MFGRMQGLTWESLKKNYMLIPLFFCIGFGACAASGYILRCAIKSPDVAWSNKRNPEPWNEYKDKDYKFISIQDKSKYKTLPPEY
ncbi:PREDICTED: cytochrome c oxidase subunit NDUFA4 [Eufriesea mexicana]|uniref:cytochrome c oxidase subunit NDUFA4 n=1 Tax=Eufriesea mexicana TaxID=516756 RepID=UPI00083C052E|nr:PREDICTED: cytochrome c oxidase subunit NDUFA4 [Eufriesea mexicana]